MIEAIDRIKTKLVGATTLSSMDNVVGRVRVACERQVPDVWISGRLFFGGTFDNLDWMTNDDGNHHP